MNEKRHIIPAASWRTVLPDTIRIAQDGDTIECPTEAVKELGERAHARMCPDKRLEFEVAQ